jgi:hypothetical protein
MAEEAHWESPPSLEQGEGIEPCDIRLAAILAENVRRFPPTPKKKRKKNEMVN